MAAPSAFGEIAVTEALKKDDAKPAWPFVVGLVCYLSFFIGGVFFLKGVLLGEEGLKGIMAGSLIGLAVFAVLNGMADALVKKRAASGSAPARLEIGKGLALLAVSAAFAWAMVRPLLKADPSTYYYGTATGQYEVTYGSGRVEKHSGAELGEKKWGWAIGIYGAIAIVNLACSLGVLGTAVLRLRKA